MAYKIRKETLKEYFSGTENDFNHLLKGVKVNGAITLDKESMDFLLEYYDANLTYDFWKKYWTGIKTFEELKQDPEYLEMHKILLEEVSGITNYMVLENYKDFLMTVPIPESVSNYIRAEIEAVEREHLRLGTIHEIIN